MNRFAWFEMSALAVAMFTVTGCQTIPEDALRLTESSLEIRAIQSRTYEVPAEKDILNASVSVLQDMEYNIEEIEKPLGILTASKTTDASSPSEITALVMLDILCALGGGGGCAATASASDSQIIMLTVVVLPSLARQGSFVTRITLQRVVRDTQGRIKIQQQIDDPKLYQEIFDKLSKSIFLETNTA